MLALGLWVPTYSLRMGTWDLRMVTYGLRMVTCDLRMVTCGLRRVTCDLRRVTCDLRMVTCDLRRVFFGVLKPTAGMGWRANWLFFDVLTSIIVKTFSFYHNGAIGMLFLEFFNGEEGQEPHAYL